VIHESFFIATTAAASGNIPITLRCKKYTPIQK
jgi:hypothetical protein